MLCPVCNKWAGVLETRARPGNVMHRRYVCGNEHRFTTRESVHKVIAASLGSAPHLLDGAQTTYAQQAGDDYPE